MDIEVEFPFQVMGTEFSEAIWRRTSQLGDPSGVQRPCGAKRLCVLSFIPGHDVGESNLVHSGKEGNEGEEEGRDEELPLVQSLQYRGFGLG